MARTGHFGDASGKWNEIASELWSQLGIKVPYEVVARVRHIRASRNRKQGNTEKKREVKLLLAIRDGIDWRQAESMEVDHIISMRDGGQEVASNVRLLTQQQNIAKGASSGQ